ncbi:hypothetical protein, partial [Pseudomonas fluorescens]|uniref:hypothetical protein n=1 Tax=Pseudomonas fluorescens TaxID=294 RepID=UPI001C4E2B11
IKIKSDSLRIVVTGGCGELHSGVNAYVHSLDFQAATGAGSPCIQTRYLIASGYLSVTSSIGGM